MCNHELKHLMGIAGGVVCRNCGQHFDHIPKQNEVPKADVKADEVPDDGNLDNLTPWMPL